MMDRGPLGGVAILLLPGALVYAQQFCVAGLMVLLMSD